MSVKKKPPKKVPILTVPMKLKAHRHVSRTGKVKAVVKAIPGKPVRHP
jgi:hypothetical protein